MTDTKISEVAIDAATRVLADAKGHGMREKAVVLAERVLAAALPYLRPQPAELAEQQVDPAWSLHDRVEFALRDAGFDFDEASRIALQVDGKQQVGEVQGDALAQFEAWATSKGLNVVRSTEDTDRYAHTDTFYAWQGYQASLAARKPGEMSAEASQVARGMVAHCIEHRLCMGMDEGFASFDPDVEHPFVLELRGFADGAVQPAQGIDLGPLREL